MVFLVTPFYKPIMDEHQEKLNKLLQQLETLVERQESFSKEVNELRQEIKSLQHKDFVRSLEKEIEETPATKQEMQQEREDPFLQAVEAPKQKENEEEQGLKRDQPFKVKTDLEKFIGENLINKIGIAITVFGVAIGTKYSIEHELLSPLTRIILGYLSGLALLGVGIKLKRNFSNYSAVLVSGAMVILYFITFSAYSFYELIPITMAFLLMVVFTIFTVVASLSYSNQIIALIGLVGAYAVPFLLSEDSGNVKFLFSYMAMINVGILVIAFRKYWKLLYYASLLLTWLIFTAWFLNNYRLEDHFALALVFSSIFFLTFYITFLAYKLIKKEAFVIHDIILLIINSFIFYGIGYALLEDHEVGAQLLGLFTVCNGLIHFIVSIIVFRQKLSDRNLFYLVSGLVLVFITIAIPVQLDGRWVTLLWIGETALLFWIGRTKCIPVYEKISYPLLVLAFISMIQDWTVIYMRFIPNESGAMITPIFNIHFLSSILFVLALGFISVLYYKKEYKAPALPPTLRDILSFVIPGMLLFTVFFAIKLEIDNYWNQLYAASGIDIKRGDSEYLSNIKNYNLRDIKTVWTINYSLLFVTVLVLINMLKIKSTRLGFFNLVINATILLIFLTQGLYVLSDLRESYLSQDQSEYYHIGIFNLVIRYISFVFVAALIISSYWLQKQSFFKKERSMEFNLAMHAALIWILSSELIHWLDMAGSTQSYKLGLSILWGTYSLFLIILGIWRKKKYLRVGAISLFAATLIKLFAYDIANLETIPKTIVLVSLGTLLLIISFLYNKYKHKIADERQN